MNLPIWKCASHYSMRLVAGLTLAVTAALPSAAASKPNVVIVITDDQGYGDLSCHGNPILKTPHMDALHDAAVRLTDYHVSPTCSPTRSAFLTGHWSNRTGVWHTIMGRSMLRSNEVTLGTVFKQGGYATGMFGKWHLGDNYPYRPEDRGFDEVLRHGGGGVGQTPDYWDNAYFDGSYWHNGKPLPVEGYCTDVFFRFARQFIKSSADAGRPFVAYIATNAPHGPMHAPEEFSQPYKHLGPHVANFFGMVANIDANVGELRDFLENEGLANNTIFIFTTDNGTSTGEKVFNAGMRGKKGSEFDGGHRVPFFVYWPDGNLTGGRDVGPITAHVDVLPTLIELCGIAAPASLRFDGASLANLLDARSDGDWPDRVLVTDSQRVKDPIKWRKSAVMTSRWRLINGEQLYDVHADPGQRHNVANNQPDVVERLRSFYDSWWQELLPTFNEPAAIALGHDAENPSRLTSHDWITEKSTPWNQAHVRRGLNGSGNVGFWYVDVTQPGTYEFELRRWPREVDLPLTAPLAAGAPVPGDKAFRVTPGAAIPCVRANLKVGEQSLQQEIASGARHVTFAVQLPRGPTRVKATLTTEDEVEYGAYYVYVRRK